MSEPSWLPSSWPSSWPDYEDIYRSVTHRFFPAIWTDDSQAWLDQEVVGHILSWVRKSMEYLVRRIFPHLDTGDLFLEWWEKALSLASTGDVTTRTNRVLAKMRNRGTLTMERLQAIMAPIMNIEDPTNVYVINPDMDDVIATGTTDLDNICDNAFFYHVYNGGVATSFDSDEAMKTINRIKQAGDHVTIGVSTDFEWDTADHGWDESVFVL